jgi:hypothetical protein
MPLFRSSEPAPPPPEEPRHHGLFSRNHDTTSNTHVEEEPKHHSLFSRNRNSTSSDPSINSSHSSRHSTSASSHGSTRRSHNLLHRGDRDDPSVTAAYDQVRAAEAAEAEADRALISARQAVKDARAHVKRIEVEAAEEARLAQIKQQKAAAIGKRAKPLGRKFFSSQMPIPL